MIDPGENFAFSILMLICLMIIGPAVWAHDVGGEILGLALAGFFTLRFVRKRR